MEPKRILTGAKGASLQVKVHGLLTAAMDRPDEWLHVQVPPSITVADLIDLMGELLASPLFDAGSCMATIDGKAVPLDYSLEPGQAVELYHLFSGG